MSAAIEQVADQVRGIPLEELLRWHGFKITKEGVSFRARNEGHNIVVTGNKWFDNKASIGGAGAIDLQMHLCGGDFQTTCHVLADGFRPTGAGLLFPPDRNPGERRRPFEELAAQYAFWIYTPSLVDASGVMPPKSLTPAFVAITGNGQGRPQ